jgi:predicted ATPase
LAGILRTDRERFLALEKHFYKRFPSYERIELPLARVQVEGDGVGLCFMTSQGQLLQAASVSDGVMLSLAYLAICYQLTPPNLLLIEEPENGVHHSSLKDIVDTLKQLSAEKSVQVIMTTHSPYLLDGVDPGVVQVFQKDEEGAVHAKKLSDFEGAGEISDMFSTGEKWSLLSEKYGI